MAIEQTLMRYAKSSGGISHGRFGGDKEAAHRVWVNTLTHFSEIDHLLSDEKPPNRHKECQESRKTKDIKALLKMVNWLEGKDMFAVAEAHPKAIVSLSSGLTSTDPGGWCCQL